MEKVLRITSLKDKKSDFIFWNGKSFSERLEAIEFLRNQYFSLNNHVQQEFQRVCRVVNQKDTQKCLQRQADFDNLQE